LATKVFPPFGPIRRFNVHLPELFNPWVAKLEAASGGSVSSFHDLSTRSPSGTVSFTRWAAASRITD